MQNLPKIAKLGRYRHYKGANYNVIGTALHTETNERLVVYRALYDVPDLKREFGDDPLFVRPYDMFYSMVEVNGKLIPRFHYIEKE